MKKYMIIGMMLVSGVIFSQEVVPVLEAVGTNVKATYYHDNGQIQQEGLFKEGKPDGKWVAFDNEGNKKSIGEYTNGEKSGKWFFWTNAGMSEVDYTNSRVALVTNWKKDALVDRN